MMTSEPKDSERSRTRRPSSAWFWATAATCAALVPVHGVFSLDRVFHVRDLGLFFWGRYLWIRRSLWEGVVPFWDPFLAGGQSTAADALNQLFFLPTVLVRMLGSEAVGFNLWVALPFPLIGLGTYRFLRLHFSRPAATLGAVTFAVCGPVVSTGNFPNMSWTVAGVPWVLWAASRYLAARSARRLAVLALCVGAQALAGEPVTWAATQAMVLGLALVVGTGGESLTRRLAGSLGVMAAALLGLALSAVQTLPLTEAVRESWRPYALVTDFWSLHPLALVEVVSPHLFGDYFAASNLTVLPWMPPLNSGRDPFFYSIYVGPTVVAMALFGTLAGAQRRWAWWWVTAAVVGLFCAFGSYSPVFPFLQAHLPFINTFRFPVKFLIVVAMSLASLAAASWDAMSGLSADDDGPGRRLTLARVASVAVPLAIAVGAYVASAATIYLPEPTGRMFAALAEKVGVTDPEFGARFLLQVVPTASTRVALFALAASLFLWVATSVRGEARLARRCLYGLVCIDLMFHSLGINPTIDKVHFAEPTWVGAMRAAPDARFYVGGKRNGTLDARDIDSTDAFFRAPGLEPVQSRAALSQQAAFHPAAWRVREFLSYDLAVLWPRAYGLTQSRFESFGRIERDRFLDRVGVRYRILPDRLAAGRRPLERVKYFRDMALYDFGDVAPRAFVVPEAIHVPNVRDQVRLLFTDEIDLTRRAMLAEVPPEASGHVGAPLAPTARIVEDGTNSVVIEATTGTYGGFLVLSDSYTKDWQASVDGDAAPVLRANALFRAVRLEPGRHTVRFYYRPQAVMRGAAVSALASLLLLGLWIRRRPTNLDVPHAA